MPRRTHLSRSKFLQFFALLAFSLTAFATVNADPITVSGNMVIVNGLFGPTAGANLTGTNFSASITDFGGADHFGYFGISPCTRSIAPLIGGPCTTANLGYNGVGEWHGSVTFNGITFNSGVVDNLNITWTSPTWIIPADLLDDGAVRITAPFTLTGFGAGPALGVQTIMLEGQGTAVLLLTRQTVGGFTGLFLERVDYTFGTPAPGVTIESVPEPTTLALLFTGLAGAAVRVRHRLRRPR